MPGAGGLPCRARRHQLHTQRLWRVTGGAPLKGKSMLAFKAQYLQNPIDIVNQVIRCYKSTLLTNCGTTKGAIQRPAHVFWPDFPWASQFIGDRSSVMIHEIYPMMFGDITQFYQPMNQLHGHSDQENYTTSAMDMCYPCNVNGYVTFLIQVSRTISHQSSVAIKWDPFNFHVPGIQFSYPLVN